MLAALVVTVPVALSVGLGVPAMGNDSLSVTNSCSIWSYTVSSTLAASARYSGRTSKVKSMVLDSPGPMALRSKRPLLMKTPSSDRLRSCAVVSSALPGPVFFTVTCRRIDSPRSMSPSPLPLMSSITWYA